MGCDSSLANEGYFARRLTAIALRQPANFLNDVISHGRIGTQRRRIAKAQLG